MRGSSLCSALDLTNSNDDLRGENFTPGAKSSKTPPLFLLQIGNVERTFQNIIGNRNFFIPASKSLPAAALASSRFHRAGRIY
jgi:hypothetical protein